MNNKIKSNSGFAMVEVLVSVIILAVGLLGLLGLQMTSLKNNHSAHYRTMAIVNAYDILERIRVNKSADYSLAMNQTPSGTSVKDTDLAEWINQISADLPKGDGEVKYNGDIVLVRVQWDDSRADGASQQVFELSTLP